ncbi:hypothetical protein, partial [Rhizobium leguminosarum]|uniref:hypothetical protein n=1 Tax=Rhizobium leguminosarum TaxID=384 RepID=UPI003F99382B
DQALASARQTEALSRAPVDQARSSLNALETEARTISRMLAAGAAAGKFTPVADELKVDRGFETALGAALGDDLESP